MEKLLGVVYLDVPLWQCYGWMRRDLIILVEHILYNLFGIHLLHYGLPIWLCFVYMYRCVCYVSRWHWIFENDDHDCRQSTMIAGRRWSLKWCSCIATGMISRSQVYHCSFLDDDSPRVPCVHNLSQWENTLSMVLPYYAAEFITQLSIQISNV